MKKLVLLFGITLFMLNTNAQLGSLMIGVSGKVGTTKGSSFEKFVTSYNNANPTNKSKLPNFGSCTGWAINADWWFKEGIFMGYYQHKISAYAASQINEYYTREFYLTQRSWGADFGGGVIQDNNGIAGFFGVYYASAVLTSGIKYRDGYKSIGNDGILNGIYHGFGFSGSLGVKAFQLIGPVAISSSVRWCPMSGIIEMSDYGKGSNNKNALLYLPEDLSGIAGGPNSYQGKNVKASFQSFFFDLGIAINLSGIFK